MRALWSRLVHIGTEGLPVFEQRYVVLTNAVAFIGVFTVVLYLPFAVVNLNGDIAWRLAGQVPLYGVAVFFNHKRRPVLATTWLAIATGLVFLSQAIYFGHQSAHRFFYLSFLAAVPFMFAKRHRFVAAAFLLFGGAALFYLEIFRPGPLEIFSVEQLKSTRLSILIGSALSIIAIAITAQRAVLAAERRAEEAHARSEALLERVFPLRIKERLKDNETIADQHDDVTVLFADLVGFTARSKGRAPATVARELNAVFSGFDALTRRFHLEKVKTIGDAYLAVAGLDDDNAHADNAVAMARAMLEMMKEFDGLEVRIGIDSGPVVAGVIGQERFAWDVWGDTVNTASRMESTGVPGAVQCTARVVERARDDHAFTARGTQSIKGQGEMETYLVKDR